MNKFTHKELGLVSIFEDIETAQDKQDWIRLVEKLPVIRAAQVMREVLLYKVEAPKETRERVEEAEAKAEEAAWAVGMGEGAAANQRR